MERWGGDHLIPVTRHLDLLVDAKELRKDIETLLQQVRPLWKPTDIKLKIFTSGNTNRLVGCHVDQDMEEAVLVRMYGNMTELYVDHATEVKHFQLLHAHHCAPELYCTFQNGLCYEFIKGAVLDRQQLRKPSIFRLVAIAMAQFHSVQSDNSYSPEPNLWTNLSKYLKLLKSSQSQLAADRSSLKMNSVPSFDILVTEIEALKEHLLQMKSPLVLCHNDLLCNNIIHIEGKGEVKFIDYEYTGYNYQAYDIGNHFNEFAGVSELDFSLYPPEELQLEWLRSYLQMYKAFTGQDPEVTQLEVQKLCVQANKFALASHLSWGLWALLQTRYSSIDFDFPRYARERFQEYFKRKDEFLALKLPC
ncbi:ethanolamine kinase 1-like isoform X1 [Rhinoraja longicauda]